MRPWAGQGWCAVHDHSGRAFADYLIAALSETEPAPLG